jgi:hypothetical protein
MPAPANSLKIDAKEMDAAAVMIQTQFRGIKARKHFKGQQLKAGKRTSGTRSRYIPIFHPQGTFRTTWDITAMLFLLYNVIVVPFRIAWDMQAPIDQPVFWIESFFDLFFLCDICVNFRTAVFRHGESGELITDARYIATHYLRSW